MNQQMSLYIPHVFVNITEERMVQSFQKRQIGKVNHVDFVAKFGKGNKIHHSAYLHFDYWYDTKASQDMQSDLEIGKEVRMYYDDPWYWLVYENGVMKNEIQEREEEVIKKPIQRYERKQVLYLGDNKPKDYENDLASEIEIEKLFKKYNIKKCQLENGEVIEDKKNTIIVSTC